MGEEIKVSNFCEKELKDDKSYARAFIRDGKVICQSASRVIMSLECGKNSEYCKDKDIGCFKLKERFATRLKLSHGSVVNNKLNCYFSSLDRGEELKLSL